MDNTNNVVMGEAYYTAMSHKNIVQMEQYLCDDVELIGPFGRTVGKDAVIESVKKFTSYFETLSVRTVFGSEKQAIVVYDVCFPGSIGNVRSTSLLTFENGCVKNMELFFDASPFIKQ